MTTPHNKVGAYSSHQRGKEDARETDARALLSCASRLKAAIEDGGKDMKAYGDAIRHNQRLWTIFQVALCDPENPLPQHLKVTLLNLSRYVDRVSFRAVTSFQPQLLTDLIEINRSIAAGLTKKPQSESPPVEAIATGLSPAPVFGVTTA
jgi:flagellar protein FlaF